MWAVVIVDLRRRRVVASRDRFGIKPLYWTIRRNELLLASEIKQIIAAGLGKPRLFTPLAAKLLHGARFPNLNETYFEGIRPVPAATWFEWPLDGDAPPEPRFRSYWALP